jgi:predicted DNA repair protein MutK
VIGAPRGAPEFAGTRKGTGVSTGLIALLDDVVGIAKVAAASLDDVTAQATKASAKAAGIVIDDTAVTPRYVVGFTAQRELPIIGKIALGSLRNKLVILLPGAILLGVFAPWAITPLLMLGGAYLCYEGAEKAWEAMNPHAAHAHAEAKAARAADAQALEDQKVRGAIRTDLILSAEIMAITLSQVAEASFWTQVAVLAFVGVAITAGVYGVVALIVKADDAGLALSQSPSPALARLGCFLVRGMPKLLKLLAAVGTAAMLWVGGGIIVHGLEHYGFTTIGHAIHDLAVAVGHALPAMGPVFEWLVTAAGSGLFGLAIGAVLIPLVHHVAEPLWHRLRRRRAVTAEG